MKELVSVIKELLKIDVKPAMGCTEPACCAVTAAYASSLAEGDIIDVKVTVSPNVLKNAFEVGIPGTGGMTGMNIAVALGIVLADPSKGLELFESVDSKVFTRAKSLEDKIEIRLHDGDELIYVDVEIETENSVSRAVVAGSHENLVYLSKNSDVRINREFSEEVDEGEKFRSKLVKYSFKEIIRGIEQIDSETIDFALKGLDMNLEIARFGLENPYGMGIGYHYKKLIEDVIIADDFINKAKMLTAGAVDARMHGVDMPVMTSCGSGNQGILATIPLYVVAKKWGQGREKLAKAIILSHLTNSFIKHYTGKLSAMCGCVTAGMGTALGAGYLFGLRKNDAAGIINNMAGNLAGIICDGAKAGCSLKLATGVDSSLTSAIFIQKGVKVPDTNGICGATAEESIINMARVVAPGMVRTDKEIQNIILKRNN